MKKGLTQDQDQALSLLDAETQNRTADTGIFSQFHSYFYNQGRRPLIGFLPLCIIDLTIFGSFDLVSFY